jgi:hypothetical protein
MLGRLPRSPRELVNIKQQRNDAGSIGLSETVFSISSP